MRILPYVFGIEKRGGRIELPHICSFSYLFPLQSVPGTYFKPDPGHAVHTEGRTTQTKVSAFCGAHFLVDCRLIKLVDDEQLLGHPKHWMAVYRKQKAWQIETIGQIWKDYKNKNLRARIWGEYGTMVTLREDLGILVDNKFNRNWYSDVVPPQN